jgi:hypothetical protein
MARGRGVLAVALGAAFVGACAMGADPPLEPRKEADVQGADGVDDPDAGPEEHEPHDGSTVAQPKPEPDAAATLPDPRGDDDPLVEDDAAVPAVPTALLPFAVDDHFIASGYMGDAMVDPLSVVMTPKAQGEDETCGGERQNPIARGRCYRITYKPSSVASAPGWAGVFWQAHLSDWGNLPGVRVESGARRVVFYAKGAVGGELVTFGVGGIMSAGMAHQDSFDKQITVTLTSAWQRYELSLAGESYDDVLGGFRWAAGKATGDLTFLVDDIHWE